MLASEAHEGLEPVFEGFPRVVVVAAGGPVVFLDADVVDDIVARVPVVGDAAVIGPDVANLEGPGGHDPGEANVVDALRLEDIVELAEGCSVVIGVAEGQVLLVFGFVVEAEDHRVAVSLHTIGEVEHLVVDLGPGLSVGDVTPANFLAVVALRLDRCHQLTVTVAGPAVQALVLANPVVPVAEGADHGQGHAELVLETFECGLVGEAVDRGGICTEGDATTKRVGPVVGTHRHRHRSEHRRKQHKHHARTIVSQRGHSLHV